MFRCLNLLPACVCFTWACPAFADLYTLDGTSPTLGMVPATPADILVDTSPPMVGIPAAGLGLMAGDIVDAISDGTDPLIVPHVDYLSVTPGSAGLPGSGVTAEVAADTAPGATPGHASDIFVAGLGVPLGTNILAPAGFGWTLGTTTGDEANAGLANPAMMLPGDNVNAYDLTSAPAAIFFSLTIGSPTLFALGATPNDILTVGPMGTPIVFLPGALLGLPALAELDALALLVGPGGPVAIEYSLTTATAGPLGFSGADILGPGPVVVHAAAAIGLALTDDLDALDADPRGIPEPSAFLFGGLVCGVIGLAWASRRIVRVVWR
jgi:hypothetical protein